MSLSAGFAKDDAEGLYRLLVARGVVADPALKPAPAFGGVAASLANVEMVKTRLADLASRPVAQRVLAYALDTLLRLLHPIVPFVTEEVWHLLAEYAPKRGLDSPAAPAESNQGEIARIISTFDRYGSDRTLHVGVCDTQDTLGGRLAAQS